jgi:hypothetical protein
VRRVGWIPALRFAAAGMTPKPAPLYAGSVSVFTGVGVGVTKS